MTDTMFEEYLTAFKKKQGLDGCPRPITYGEDDIRAAFQAGQEADKWISVEERLPAIGERVLLFDSVVQHETYWFDAYDSSDYTTEFFWDSELLEEGVDIEPNQMWQPLPPAPEEIKP